MERAAHSNLLEQEPVTITMADLNQLLTDDAPRLVNPRLDSNLPLYKASVRHHIG